MKISNNYFSLDFFKNLNKNNEDVKSKPKTEIQLMLERRNKEIENTNLHYRKESIARKIAKGHMISSEERALLEKHDPDLLRKAISAAKRRKELEQRLKRAKTEREAKSIMLEARVEVHQASKDKEYANLLTDAYNEADAKKSKKGKKRRDAND